MNRSFIFDLMPRHGVCAEIGVWKGTFSEWILDKNCPNKFYLIDPWIYVPKYNKSLYGNPKMNQKKMDEIHAQVARKFAKNKEVEIVRKRSAEAASEFPDEYFDWIYIDGDHSYSGVLKDLEAYLPKIKSGGFIVGDDYHKGGWWKNGVIQAVQDFIKKNTGKCALIKTQNVQYVIKKF